MALNNVQRIHTVVSLSLFLLLKSYNYSKLIITFSVSNPKRVKCTYTFLDFWFSRPLGARFIPHRRVLRIRNKVCKCKVWHRFSTLHAKSSIDFAPYPEHWRKVHRDAWSKSFLFFFFFSFLLSLRVEKPWELYIILYYVIHTTTAKQCLNSQFKEIWDC